MLKKETFIKLMTELIRLKEVERECNAVFKKISPEFNFFCLDAYEDIVYKAISETMGDESHWTGYWLYELDCGKRAKDNSVKIDDKNVPIKTLDDLYNVIVMDVDN